MIDLKRAKIKTPVFCRHPEKENCRGCEYSRDPEAYDPGCTLEKGDEKNVSTDNK